MTKTMLGETLFEFSDFGYWKLFDICNLLIGIWITVFS